jgi:type VI secretion system protein ImpM
MPGDAPGWYGKLAALGDFAQRRVSPEWVQACDAWLSHAMRAGSEQLGAGWFEVYLTAPLLRFAWAPGVMGDGWWFGVLMPSCDAVGRYFPLLIAQPRLRAPSDRVALDHLELWYERVAQAALHTLHDQASLEDFEAILAELPPWPSVRHLPPGPTATLAEQMHAMAARELLERLRRCSLWWHAGGGISVLPGLPDAAAFVDLLGSPTGPP